MGDRERWGGMRREGGRCEGRRGGSVQVCEYLGVQMCVRDLGAVVRMCSDEVRV